MEYGIWYLVYSTCHKLSGIWVKGEDYLTLKVVVSASRLDFNLLSAISQIKIILDINKLTAKS
jgi:hypothetical protein